MPGPKFRNQSNKKHNKKKHYRQPNHFLGTEANNSKQESETVNQNISSSWLSFSGLAKLVGNFGLYKPKEDNKQEVKYFDVSFTSKGFKINGLEFSLNYLPSNLKNFVLSAISFLCIVQADAQTYNEFFGQDRKSNTTFLLNMMKDDPRFRFSMTAQEIFASCNGTMIDTLDSTLFTNFINSISLTIGGYANNEVIESLWGISGDVMPEKFLDCIKDNMTKAAGLDAMTPGLFWGLLGGTLGCVLIQAVLIGIYFHCKKSPSNNISVTSDNHEGDRLVNNPQP